MKLITVAGPPSSGKTAVLTKVIEHLTIKKCVGVVKMDCLATTDDLIYEKKGILVKVGLSGGICPDHFFATNIEDIVHWGHESKLDYLITESAGLCNRCSPHIKDVFAVCIVDHLSGVDTPKKIGPMLKLADIIVITKGDIVSQAEREVFSYRVRQANQAAKIIHVNGITGQGAAELAKLLSAAPEVDSVINKRLRFTMPAALCSYCLGETEIGKDYQIGNIKTLNWN
jgi:Ni2+-binding GTPase involved in maturation of urease and hydrogenase